MGFGDDDRECFRAATVERCEGTLHFGDTRIRVQVVDQSATGFKLSTQDLRPIPNGSDAVFATDDGVQHMVQIRRLESDGSVQTLGVSRLETSVRKQDNLPSQKGPLRLSATKLTALVLIVVISGLALQAASIPERIAELPLFGAPPTTKPVAKPSAVAPQRSESSGLSRERPFEFRRCLDDETADWLRLERTQRSAMRALIELCGGIRDNRLPPAQRAFVEFAAQSSMLELLSPEQRNQLETELGQPLSGSALLRNVIERHYANESTEEMAKAFGALLIASPKFAARYGIPESVTVDLCKQLDAAIKPAFKGTPSTQADFDADQVVFELIRRMKELEATVQVPKVPASSKQTE